jgi:hypothetical protein
MCFAAHNKKRCDATAKSVISLPATPTMNQTVQPHLSCDCRCTHHKHHLALVHSSRIICSAGRYYCNKHHQNLACLPAYMSNPPPADACCCNSILQLPQASDHAKLCPTAPAAAGYCCWISGLACSTAGAVSEPSSCSAGTDRYGDSTAFNGPSLWWCAAAAAAAPWGACADATSSTGCRNTLKVKARNTSSTKRL